MIWFIFVLVIAVYLFIERKLVKELIDGWKNRDRSKDKEFDWESFFWGIIYGVGFMAKPMFFLTIAVLVAVIIILILQRL